jgi:CMP-N,N'-diacetyllegionaminic acid synthase
MNILFTVCGREGSKGLKNKNILKLKGFPLIYYTIAVIELFREKRQDLCIDSCINSDGKTILNICEKFEKFILIDRPKELATEFAPKIPVVAYSLAKMEKIKKIIYDYVIDLDITSPLRTIEDIEKAIDTIINTGKQLVFSVVPARRNPYFNMVERQDDKIIKCKASNFVRRQDAPKIYDMNASIYCFSRNALTEEIKKTPLEYDCEIVEMLETGIIDVDSKDDFLLLSILSNFHFKQRYASLLNYLKSQIQE